MKRLFVFVLIILLLCGINLGVTNNFTISKIFNGCSVEVYLKSHVENCEFLSVKNGEGSIIFCEVNDLIYILNNPDVCGYTIKINNKNYHEVLNCLNVSYMFASFGCVYGKSNLFNFCTSVNDNVVNFQCVKNDDFVLLGSPILLGSY